MRALLISLSAVTACCALPALAQGGAATRPSPSTAEVAEDLRILSILNVLNPTRDQSTRLSAVAESGRAGIAQIDAEVDARVDQIRDGLLAARQMVLRGGAVPRGTEETIINTNQQAASIRATRTETLVQNLAARVRRILTTEQGNLIEAELAPGFEQDWRRYGGSPGGTAGGVRPSGDKMPVDPGWWLKELRDLRIDSAEGDPAHEVQDFGKKITRGIRPGTPHFEQAMSQGMQFASQVLQLPQNIFLQRERELARMAAKQQLEVRNQQRILEGKTVEVFDPFRWLVEEVLLSPRAAGALKDRAG